MDEPLERYRAAVEGLIATTEQFARAASDRGSAATALINAADQLRLTANWHSKNTLSAIPAHPMIYRRVAPRFPGPQKPIAERAFKRVAPVQCLCGAVGMRRDSHEAARLPRRCLFPGPRSPKTNV